MDFIKSLDNTKIKNFRKIINDKKYRKSEQLFVCEGEKMLLDAISQDIFIDTLIISENYKLNIDIKSDNILQVPHHIFEKIADTKNPQGVIFSCKITKSKTRDLKKVIILDNLQDPGNMGTIIRSACAFKIDAVILLNNCVDVYSPKVVRSTMSAIFSVPILNMTVEECFKIIDIPIYATYLDEESVDISKVCLKESAVIIGNESNGVSSEVLKYASEKIIIPIANMQSLNASVAGGIVMWEMSK
ncbi:MAG: RNA methyltransferase [Clostridia bacterium]